MVLFFEFTIWRYFKYDRHRAKFKFKDGGKFKYGCVCEFTIWRYFKYGGYAVLLNFKKAEYLNMTKACTLWKGVAGW
jgi:hypothetical protein